jgi:hypothetical protein
LRYLRESIAPVVQLDRTTASGAVGCAFEPRRAQCVVRKRSCCKKDYDFIEKLIAKHGKQAQWRKHRYTFLLVDGLVYWVDEPVINRTDKRSLMNGGYPAPDVLAQIRKRFWPTKST